LYVPTVRLVSAFKLKNGDTCNDQVEYTVQFVHVATDQKLTQGMQSLFDPASSFLRRYFRRSFVRLPWYWWHE